MVAQSRGKRKEKRDCQEGLQYGPDSVNPYAARGHPNSQKIEETPPVGRLPAKFIVFGSSGYLEVEEQQVRQSNRPRSLSVSPGRTRDGTWPA